MKVKFFINVPIYIMSKESIWFQWSEIHIHEVGCFLLFIFLVLINRFTTWTFKGSGAVPNAGGIAGRRIMILQTNQMNYGTSQYGATKTFERKTTGRQSEDNQKTPVRQEYLQLIRDKIGEMYDKVENNETEESFQIGANSFTQSQWDKLLSEFDDIQETIRKLMREEFEKRQEQKVEQERLDAQYLKEEIAADTVTDIMADALISESVICEYPLSDSETEKVLHVVWYNEDGIYCKKMGQERLEWAITFDSNKQYQSVHEFMKRFDKDDNLSFAPNQNFWQDFLAGAFNVDEFIASFEIEDK